MGNSFDFKYNKVKILIINSLVGLSHQWYTTISLTVLPAASTS